MHGPGAVSDGEEKLAAQMNTEREAEIRHQKQQRALVAAEKYQMKQAKKAFSKLLGLLLEASQEDDAWDVVSSPAFIAKLNALMIKHSLAIRRADKSLRWLVAATNLTPSRVVRPKEPQHLAHIRPSLNFDALELPLSKRPREAGR